MRELLTAAVRVGGVTHLVGPVTMVLQGGPRFVCSSENNILVSVENSKLHCIRQTVRSVWKLRDQVCRTKLVTPTCIGLCRMKRQKLPKCFYLAVDFFFHFVLR